jgi:hypothetical protein
MLETQKFKEGVIVCREDVDFEEGLGAAVDYRGDITLELRDGGQIEGFLFNANSERLDLFPKNSPQKQSVMISDVNSIVFSGKDEAAGKSWDDWIKKREEKKNHREM